MRKVHIHWLISSPELRNSFTVDTSNSRASKYPDIGITMYDTYNDILCITITMATLVTSGVCLLHLACKLTPSPSGCHWQCN